MAKASLLDSARQFMKENKKKDGRACGTCSLPPETISVVHTLKDEGWSAPLLSQWLKKNGHNINHAALKHHLANHRAKA